MLANKALSAAPSAVPVYVEDIFSSYLYTGNGSTQTITNNIDLSTKGGLVWIKGRSNAEEHALFDTNRGAGYYIQTQSTAAQASESGFSSFGSTGFSLAANVNVGINNNNRTYVSWTFAKQAKFFDVVTYTGNGNYARTVSHNLGSVPGCIIVKRTDSTSDWYVLHRGTGSSYESRELKLNSTAADASTFAWGGTKPTSTVFYVGDTGAGTNENGGTYVAYLFAHDAGGFGASGSDNVITCGSYTGNGADNGPTVTLGYEPQWVLVKRSDSTGGWRLIDNMRGNSLTSQAVLSANSSSAESTTSEGRLAFTATGFKLIYGSDSDLNSNGGTYIYIAIRRGPMKTPTSATTVFSREKQNSSSPQKTLPDAGDLFVMFGDRSSPTTPAWLWADRLRGLSSTTGVTILDSSSTAAEATRTTSPYIYINTSNERRLTFVPSSDNMTYRFSRAPGFFDVVCYTGTGSAQTVSHNLGVVPELIIIKDRNTAGGANWWTYSATIGNTKALILNDTGAATSASSNYWNNTSPTSTQFTAGYYSSLGTGYNYVAYLFASLNGVSKVGTYTGNGSSQTINCGFTTGARFVLIKPTSTSGGWAVFDSARGIVAGDDPYLFMNSTDSEYLTGDYIDTDNSGFTLPSSTFNDNGVTFIYLAIA